MSYPIFSILKDFKDAVANHSSYNTKIDELTAAITAQNLMATNNVNIAFSGSAIFDQLLDPGVLVVANSNPPREVITGKSVIRRTTDNHVEVMDFTMVNGDSDLVLFNNGGDIAHLIFSNGLVQIRHTVVANNLSLQASLLFYTQPAMGTGIVGPVGPDGLDGDQWGSWFNLTLSTGVSEYDVTEPSRMRISSNGKNAQLHIQVKPTTSWNGTTEIASLSVSARPARKIRFIGIFGNGNRYPAQIYSSGSLTLFNVVSENSSQFIPIQLIYPLD